MLCGGACTVGYMYTLGTQTDRQTDRQAQTQTHASHLPHTHVHIYTQRQIRAIKRVRTHMQTCLKWAWCAYRESTRKKVPLRARARAHTHTHRVQFPVDLLLACMLETRQEYLHDVDVSLLFLWWGDKLLIACFCWLLFFVCVCVFRAAILTEKPSATNLWTVSCRKLL